MSESKKMADRGTTNLAALMQSPSEYFSDPADIEHSDKLTVEEKLCMLKSLESDVGALERMTRSNTDGRSQCSLSEVRRAIRALDPVGASISRNEPADQVN